MYRNLYILASFILVTLLLIYATTAEVPATSSEYALRTTYTEPRRDR